MQQDRLSPSDSPLLTIYDLSVEDESRVDVRKKSISDFSLWFSRVNACHACSYVRNGHTCLANIDSQLANFVCDNVHRFGVMHSKKKKRDQKLSDWVKTATEKGHYTLWSGVNDEWDPKCCERAWQLLYAVSNDDLAFFKEAVRTGSDPCVAVGRGRPKDNSMHHAINSFLQKVWATLTPTEQSKCFLVWSKFLATQGYIAIRTPKGNWVAVVNKDFKGARGKKCSCRTFSPHFNAFKDQQQQKFRVAQHPTNARQQLGPLASPQVAQHSKAARRQLPPLAPAQTAHHRTSGNQHLPPLPPPPVAQLQPPADQQVSPVDFIELDAMTVNLSLADDPEKLLRKCRQDSQKSGMSLCASDVSSLTGASKMSHQSTKSDGAPLPFQKQNSEKSGDWSGLSSLLSKQRSQISGMSLTSGIASRNSAFSTFTVNRSTFPWKSEDMPQE